MQISDVARRKERKSNLGKKQKWVEIESKKSQIRFNAIFCKKYNKIELSVKWESWTREKRSGGKERLNKKGKRLGKRQMREINMRERWG